MSAESPSFVRLLKCACTFVCFTIILWLFQNFTGAFSADRSNYWDESAHFVSALSIADYLLRGIPSNPIIFVTSYYAHFPKVAIGHWPPFFEFLQSVIFVIFGGTAVVAMVTQAIIAALCLSVTVVITSKSHGAVAGFASGLVLLLSPIFLPMINLVMADILEALAVTLTAVSWGYFYKQRNWQSCFLFAIAAMLSTLTKGTALGLGLMPLIYLAFRKDFAFILNSKTLVAAGLVAGVAVPWYLFTYHMAADGFMYKWGWNFSHLAIPFFFMGLIGTIGSICALAYSYGVFKCLVNGPNQDIQTQPDVQVFVASSLAMIVFTMLVPAYLDLRYLIPALPSVIIVAFWGFYQAIDRVSWTKSHKRAAHYIPIVVLLAATLPTVHIPRVQSLHSEVLAQEIMMSRQPNTLVLISGNVEAEGAFIASFAEIDKEKTHYIIRGQKALANSSWMTDRYESRFDSTEGVAHWIKESGIGWIVLDYDARSPDFAHNSLLRETINKGLLHTKLIRSVSHSGGQMSLYSLPAVDNVTKISANLSSVMFPGHLVR